MAIPTSEQWAAFAALFDQWEAASPEERERIILDTPDPRVARMFRLLGAFANYALDGLEGREFRDNLVLGRRMGQGGMGAIYEARRELMPSLGRRPAQVQRVAVKLVRPEILAHGGGRAGAYVNLFLEELRKLQRLNHPYIVPVVDAGEFELRPGGPRVPWFAMPWLEGDSPWVPASDVPDSDPDRHRRLLPSLDAKLKVFEMLLEAMAHAHALNALHLDLTPNNVRLVAGPEPRVIDFGLSAVLDALRPSLRHLVGNGTLGYQAPEQLSSDYGNISKATDVHALGVLGYQLFTGELPFDIPVEIDDDSQAVKAAICSTSRKSLGEYADGMSPTDRLRLSMVAGVIERAFRHKVSGPEGRWVDAGAFLKAWRQVSAGTSRARSRPKRRTPGPKGSFSQKANGKGAICAFKSFNNNTVVKASHGSIAIGGNATGSTFFPTGRRQKR